MKSLALITLAALTCLGLTACDNRKCIEHHYVPMVTVMIVNKVPIPMTHMVYICDKHEGE